jgi:hypothetical protein
MTMILVYAHLKSQYWIKLLENAKSLNAKMELSGMLTYSSVQLLIRNANFGKHTTLLLKVV